jgi:replication fork protection complex subunit Tof1/Swi1
LLELIDAMTSSTASESDSEVIEAAEILQQQLIYNGEVLDMALEGLRSYKEGTQTLTYLDSSVSLAYSLLKMLERWGKKKPEEVYVRRKARRRRRKGWSHLSGLPLKGTHEF